MLAALVLQGQTVTNILKILIIIAVLGTSIHLCYAIDFSLLGKWSGKHSELQLNDDGSCSVLFYFSENDPISSCRYEVKENELLIIHGDSRNSDELEIRFRFTIREDRIYSGENEILKKEKTNK